MAYAQSSSSSSFGDNFNRNATMPDFSCLLSKGGEKAFQARNAFALPQEVRVDPAKVSKTKLKKLIKDIIQLMENGLHGMLLDGESSSDDNDDDDDDDAEAEEEESDESESSENEDVTSEEDSDGQEDSSDSSSDEGEDQSKEGKRKAGYAGGSNNGRNKSGDVVKKRRRLGKKGSSVINL